MNKVEEKFDLTDIDADDFSFVQENSSIHDLKFDTKPIGYLEDAFRRFAKNKGSVAGGIIIFALFLFAVFTPMFSRYDTKYIDAFYIHALPKCEFIAQFGLWNGTGKYTYNQPTYEYYNAIPGAVVKVNKIQEDICPSK